MWVGGMERKAVTSRSKGAAAAVVSARGGGGCISSHSASSLTSKAPSKDPVLRMPSFRQGDRCVVHGKHGLVQFVGQISALGPGTWVGVALDEPGGTNNGRLGGRTYFECPPRHGAFYPTAEVQEEAAGDPTVTSSVASAAPASKLSRARTATSPSAAPEGTFAAAGSSREPAAAAATTSVASGRGLRTAVVKQLAQFVITAHDEEGRAAPHRLEPDSLALRVFSKPSVRVPAEPSGSTPVALSSLCL